MITRIAELPLFVIFCLMSAVPLATTGAAQSTEDDVFGIELRSHVYGSLSKLQPDSARLVMRRSGCTLTSTTVDGKVTYPPIPAQIDSCVESDAAFLCQATLHLVDDQKKPRNKFYYGCGGK
jgi:hypothetical protein